MVKLVNAKCPNCGATLKISKEEENTTCEYCKNTIIVDEAIDCFKLKVSGTISINGITTNAELIETANELLNMNEYLKAKRKFLEFSEKCPDNYQGWLGLLICRTRNFTIKDNNIMFENDINKYYEHFIRVAPDSVKKQYFETIDRYFEPEKYETTDKNEHQTINHFNNKFEDILSKIVFKIINGILYIYGGILILVCIASFKENPINSTFLILFILSLFKIFYSIIENKFEKITKKHIRTARLIIPILILVIWISCISATNVDPNKKESKNTNHTQLNNNEKEENKPKQIVYYIKYNELGEFGKYMKFEKQNAIFYYLPNGKYKVEATILNEKTCFLWIDYRKGYQNGNYGIVYDTKERLKFTNSSKTATVILDNSVHIYNSNDCDYKFTLIN